MKLIFFPLNFGILINDKKRFEKDQNTRNSLNEVHVHHRTLLFFYYEPIMNSNTIYLTQFHQQFFVLNIWNIITQSQRM